MSFGNLLHGRLGIGGERVVYEPGRRCGDHTDTPADELFFGFFVRMTEVDISRWRAPDHTTGTRRPCCTTIGLNSSTFSIEVFDERGNLLEVLARVHDLDAATAAYDACRRKYPAKLIMLCQGGRILRRSDREARA